MLLHKENDLLLSKGAGWASSHNVPSAGPIPMIGEYAGLVRKIRSHSRCLGLCGFPYDLKKLGGFSPRFRMMTEYGPTIGKKHRVGGCRRDPMDALPGGGLHQTPA